MNITNDKVTEYIQGFYKPLNNNFETLRRSAEKDRVPIILKETESFLQFFMRLERPKSVLEIGTAVGYSALMFASMGADVVTVEKDESVAEVAAKNIAEMDYADKIKVLTGDGEEAIRQNIETGRTFDLVFIDAAKSHYRRFLEAAMPHCHEGTVIISDNVLLKAATASDDFDPNGRFKTNIKNMRLYLEYISEHPKLDTVVLSCGDGLALSRYK